MSRLRPFLWLCLLFMAFMPSSTFSQSKSALAEGYLQSIGADGQVTLRLTKIRNGELPPGILQLKIAKKQFDHLYPGLRRFRSQKWLFTLKSEDQGTSYQISSAYGMGSENQEPAVEMPPPIFVTPENSIDHARYSTHNYEQEVVELTNEQRWENGMLPPYKQVEELYNSSDGHSEDMGLDNFFAHCNLDNMSTPGSRMQAAGYSYNSAAENIAAGYGSPSAVISGWMNSSGHRANILNSSRREMGVGYEYNSGDQGNVRYDQDGNCIQDASGGPFYNYWTQNFGRRNSVYPVVIERELATTDDRSVELFIYGPNDATSMRFSNDGQNWSDWIDYTPDYTWDLSTGDGIKTVYSQVSDGPNGSGSVYNASDEIELSGSCDPMVFSNTTLSGTQTYSSCEIIADPNVMIDGQIIFKPDL